MEAIRSRLLQIVGASERDDFKAYVESAQLEPLFGAFLRENGYGPGDLHPAVTAHLAQHALGELRHAFDLEIRDGRRSRQTRLRHGKSDHNIRRDSLGPRPTAPELVSRQQRNMHLLTRAMTEMDAEYDGEGYDPQPCGPHYR